MTISFRKRASASILAIFAAAGFALAAASSPALAVTAAPSRTMPAVTVPYERALPVPAVRPHLVDGKYTRQEWHRLHLLHEQHLARLTAIVTPAVTAARAVTAQPATAQPVAAYTGSSSMQSCIIRAESTGNPYAWNPTGHWGLYQFGYSTWIANGGNPASFGSAGPAEQTQVFWNTVANSGYSAWAGDGC